MSGHQHLAAGLVAVFCAFACSAADLDEIVSRGAATLKSDWAAHDNYACIEKDEVLKDDHWSGKTSRVVYIDGSDYYMPLAFDDRPLTPEQQKAEREKLKAEAARREAETPEQRRDRIAKYRKARDANEAMIRDFPDAFNFELTGEEIIDNHKAYVLAATPKKRTGPLSLAAKVLSGMRGTIWLDEEGFHAIRVKGDVVRPVPVYGILAKVLPGTHLEFAMAPAAMTSDNAAVWLVSELSMSVQVLKFFFFHSTQVTRSTYSDYRLNSDVLAELLSE